MQDHFEDMIREVDDFLVRRSKVHLALERVAQSLEEAGVEFALVGGLALGERGYVRVTVDIDILVTAQGLQRFKERWLGRGFAERSPGSRGVRESETGVAIDFWVAGEFPGDGRPKPVRFPDPNSIPREPGKMRIADVRTLIEMKLASGVSASDRLRDLADVIELIRANALPASYDSTLDPSLRPKYRELWNVAQVPPRDA